MHKITPHLWFDKEAKEAAEFYVSLFPGSKITDLTTLRDTPSGDTEVVSFELAGEPFMAISAGPHFKFNPSISFFVNFDPLRFGDASKKEEARKALDAAWAGLAEGGRVLMPLDKYPWSERSGWIQDKYGLSWQLILTNPEGEERPAILPALLFVREKCGRAAEAIDFYLSVFENSKLGSLVKYPETTERGQKDTVMFADFKLRNTWFAAMDGAGEHDFDFNEAVSFVVKCENQEEIDHYWSKLSAVPEAEQCGWLKDKYGVSWQIAPAAMDEIFKDKDERKLARVTQAFLKMKKFDLAKLKAAAEG